MVKSITPIFWQKIVNLIHVFVSYWHPLICFVFSRLYGYERKSVVDKVEFIEAETELCSSFSEFMVETFADKVKDSDDEIEEEKEKGICFSFSFPKYEEKQGLHLNMNVSESEKVLASDVDVKLESVAADGTWFHPDSSEFDPVSLDEIEVDSETDSEDESMMELKQEERVESYSYEEESSSNLFSEEECNTSDNTTDSELIVPDDLKFSNENSTEEEEEEELESLWEHQDLIEQLKIEIKKVRATGLPTILEESDSVKAFEDLRPWKIDDFKRGDGGSSIGEVHKFYRSYRERMRKFDIMNYQKMYAIGFLQLKDPLKSISTQKPASHLLKSLFRNRIHGSDPTKKFIEELQSDLEMIYVGQMCLSWEFLHWQYQKALDLCESDAKTRTTHRYIEVAGEFQQFQVLLQRFIEDEPFQAPRLQNYAKNRCIFRNLLQVPVIREDNFKDKRQNRRRDNDEYVITSEMLLEILEESIRIFWRFVRADRDCTINSHHKIPDEEDHRLLVDARKIIQKKEKKLKEILRSETCILKKLKRCSGRERGDSDPVLCFFSQVDMKLVARVLNMSRITRDQLIWCHNKLSKITFSHTKIHIEPSFLLFPC